MKHNSGQRKRRKATVGIELTLDSSIRRRQWERVGCVCVYSRQRFIVETLLKNKKEKAVRHCAVPSICLATKEQQQQQKESNGVRNEVIFIMLPNMASFFPPCLGRKNESVGRTEINQIKKKRNEMSFWCTPTPKKWRTNKRTCFSWMCVCCTHSPWVCLQDLLFGFPHGPTGWAAAHPFIHPPQTKKWFPIWFYITSSMADIRNFLNRLFLIWRPILIYNFNWNIFWIFFFSKLDLAVSRPT